jgi:hypothetical protein
MSTAIVLRRLRAALFGLWASTLWLGCGDSHSRHDEGQELDDAGADGGAGCLDGELGCRCSKGDRCGTTPSGDKLVCSGGLCQSPDCVPGSAGCACRLGSECTSDDLTCTKNVCLQADCAPGSLNCSCLLGGCDKGLICLDGAVCADAAGHEGGPCLKNGACKSGARCDPDQALCVACDLGSEGCQCTSSGTCEDGLACAADLCVSASSLPPKHPKCYTPCRSNLTTGSDTRPCDSDGLLDGCVDGKTCVEGSCVAKGQSPPKCKGDVDCPFFQACLQGQCYSNCEVNADCPVGLGCFRRVCRVPCSSDQGGASCPEGTSCLSSDGSLGYCSPTGSAGSQTSQQKLAATQAGGLATSVPQLALSNVSPSGTFTIQNGTAGAQHVTIHKLWHRVQTADGKSTRVDAKRDPSSGAFQDCDASKGECPLSWLKLAGGDAKASVSPSIELDVPASCTGADCPVITVSGAAGSNAVRWDGELFIQSDIGSASVTLSYVQTIEGRWTGTQYYFGSFSDLHLDDWLASGDKSQVTDVANGLIQVWTAFRRGGLDSWAEMNAVLNATITESWKQDGVAQLCQGVTGGLATAVCYPYSNTAGVRIYVQDSGTYPVPSGVTELPIAFNLKKAGGDETQFAGVLDSDTALQYGGRPAVALALRGDPGKAGGSCDPSVSSDCVVFVESFAATTAVGGRYVPDGAGCADGFAAVDVPWLLPDFLAGTTPDATSGQNLRRECRGTQLPYAGASGATLQQNMALASANPAPDGAARSRSLTLLDGALVNQTDLFLLFQETFPSFLSDGADSGVGSAKSYGFMLLRREPRDLAAADYTPAAQASAGASTASPAGLSCSDDLIARVGGGDPERLVPALIDGLGGLSQDYQQVASPYFVHYLCVDTGTFDDGPTSQGTPGLACPVTSEVRYFVSTQASLRDQACQADIDCDVTLDSAPTTVTGVGAGDASIPGSDLFVSCSQPGKCESTLNQWVSAGVVADGPIYTCQDGSAGCDLDRYDLTRGKTFYRYVGSSAPSIPISPLRIAINEAFRYKTQFVSESGQNLAFAPDICQPGSDQVPYCYDPGIIEDIRARLDCLISIYDTRIGASAQGTPLSPATQAKLENFLRGSFSQFDADDDGFERLYAELLTMLGDEAMSDALSSRFDLAATNISTFLGSQLEPNGVDLSGVAGYELGKLYEAAQYYQLALDRMYAMGDSFSAALSRGATSFSGNFISPETVTLYLERVAGAASKKSAAFSQIAERYLGLNRADLARAVVQREYVHTYLESVLIGQLMTRIVELSRNADKDQLRSVLEQTQLGYRTALLGMADVFRSIDDDDTVFGFPPDYIPFPALDSAASTDVNAFSVLAATANQKIADAAAQEQTAIDSAKAGRLDAADFQSQLVSVRNTYEDQLADLCGTFQADDGRVLPAIDKYASESTATLALGDPCGRVGNGQINAARGQVDDARLGVRTVISQANETIKQIQIERDLVIQQCKLTDAIADFEYQQGEKTLSLQNTIAGLQTTMATVQTATDAVVTVAGQQGNCGVTNVAECEAAVAVSAAALAVGGVTTTALDTSIDVLQSQISQNQIESAHWETETQCDSALIASNARVAELVNSLNTAQLELLRAQLQVNLAASNVESLVNQAKRIRAQEQQAEQQLLNVAASRDDPNVRIYKNDAIINAENSFNDALSAAYKATRVFEYYTSQSYANRGDLYLLRMVTVGQPNLQSYMTKLQNAFSDFQEENGLPDSRVSVLSLRDDILAIPLLDEKGDPYTLDERVAQMHEKLRDPALLDGNGYVVLPFSISLKQLSPVTRNHKLRYIEVDMVGSDLGDTLGRVYVEQAGTGVIHNLADGIDYYSLPARMEVINTFFNGSRVYTADVYHSTRLRDRPVVNGLWKLIINQRDESVNTDIDLQSLTDIRVLVYYDDFTQAD